MVCKLFGPSTKGSDPNSVKAKTTTKTKKNKEKANKCGKKTISFRFEVSETVHVYLFGYQFQSIFHFWYNVGLCSFGIRF